MSSRTVGFPKSGWRPWPVPSRPSQHHRSLSAGSHTPLTISVCPLARHPSTTVMFTGHCVPTPVLRMPAMCREPLCPGGVLLRQVWPLRPHRKELPFPLRSYGLMRQTKSLPPPSALASLDRSLQVAARPCWEMALPDVISANPSQHARSLTPVGRHGAFARLFP